MQWLLQDICTARNGCKVSCLWAFPLLLMRNYPCPPSLSLPAVPAPVMPWQGVGAAGATEPVWHRSSNIREPGKEQPGNGLPSEQWDEAELSFSSCISFSSLVDSSASSWKAHWCSLEVVLCWCACMPNMLRFPAVEKMNEWGDKRAHMCIPNKNINTRSVWPDTFGSHWFDKFLPAVRMKEKSAKWHVHILTNHF